MTALLALVAINTLLFLGLSVSKIAPWPEPLHPQILRERVCMANRVTPQEGGGPMRTSFRQGLLLYLVVALHRAFRSGRTADGVTGTHTPKGESDHRVITPAPGRSVSGTT
jgi:hypothetical protein